MNYSGSYHCHLYDVNWSLNAKGSLNWVETTINEMAENAVFFHSPTQTKELCSASRKNTDHILINPLVEIQEKKTS